MRTVTLIRAGIATTVQDVGRPGHQQSGIPPGGAMDEYAMHLGQRLLGHEDNEAALEFVYGDLAFTASDRCHFVVTGAPASITIGAAGSCSGRVIEVEANEMVTIKASGQGLYSYLHIAGGIATLPCLGSRSTSPRGGGRPRRKAPDRWRHPTVGASETRPAAMSNIRAGYPSARYPFS
ncbi:MAG: hypothetical protein VW202_01300 [Halieaceae bacterium]